MTRYAESMFSEYFHKEMTMSDEPRIDPHAGRPIEADDRGGDEPVNPAVNDQPGGGDEDAVPGATRQDLATAREQEEAAYDSEPPIASQRLPEDE